MALAHSIRRCRPDDHSKLALLYGDAPRAADLFSSITRAQVDWSKNVKNRSNMIKRGH